MGIISAIVMPLALEAMRRETNRQQIEDKGKQDRLTLESKYNYDLGIEQAKGTQSRATSDAEFANRASEYDQRYVRNMITGVATGTAGGIAAGAAKGYFTEKFRNKFKGSGDNDKKPPTSGGKPSSGVESDDAFWKRVDQQIRDAEAKSKAQPTLSNGAQVQRVIYDTVTGEPLTKEQIAERVKFAEWNKELNKYSRPGLFSVPGVSSSPVTFGII